MGIEKRGFGSDRKRASEAGKKAAANMTPEQLSRRGRIARAAHLSKVARDQRDDLEFEDVANVNPGVKQ